MIELKIISIPILIDAHVEQLGLIIFSINLSFLAH